MTATSAPATKSVTLTVQEMDIVNTILNFTSQVDAQGRPVPRVFSIKELSAKKWWHKHTDGHIDTHTELYKKKEKKIKDANKKETKELQDKLNNFKAPLTALQKKADKTDEETAKMEELTIKFQVAQGELQGHMQKLTTELNKDAELVASHHETTHELELTTHTVDLIIQCFEDFEFRGEQMVALEIFDKFKS